MDAQTTQENPCSHSHVPQPPGMNKPPPGHGRAWLTVAVAAALAMAAGGAAGLALTHTAQKPATATPTAPAPAPEQYVQDIRNAGITARASSIVTTGQQLVADWRNGHTSAWTDANVLAPGGVFPYHYAIFDQVTERDLGVHPPQQTASDPADDVSVVDQYLSDLNDGELCRRMEPRRRQSQWWQWL
jgi:hypothetical protein